MTTASDTYKTLLARLKKNWDEADVRAFGELDDPEPLALLKQAEKWLPSRSTDPTLLLTCAKLCIRTELYGKARSYLETSLAVQPRLDTTLLLAHLLEHIDQRDRAYKLLKAALTQAIGHKVTLPRIRMPQVERRKSSDRRQR